jgi:cupin fold WbuC family metalloprotein
MDPSGIRFIDRPLMEGLLARAGRSPRRRVNFNFHATAAEDPNRFLNVMLEGTYVAPHQHAQVPKPELFLVLEGQVAVFTFTGGGKVESASVIGHGAPGGRVGIDIAPAVWHTLAVLTPHAIVLEVKPGFYDPATDKQFAPWAPREGEPGAAEYLAGLVALVGGRRDLSRAEL